ncbi:MAG: hypothetical protein Q8N33_00525, partial [Rhodocyclaceae bacterium]|nr:hypothetical protein [Rhodocyclaceae bacterium]
DTTLAVDGALTQFCHGVISFCRKIVRSRQMSGKERATTAYSTQLTVIYSYPTCQTAATTQ